MQIYCEYRRISRQGPDNGTMHSGETPQADRLESLGLNMAAGKKISESELIRSELRSVSDPAKARFLARFFRTGPGEYGEGDLFLGISVPSIRKIVRAHRNVGLNEAQSLIYSEYHEERLAALLLLVEMYRRGDESCKKTIYDFYLGNTSQINNWDLVDVTAPHIVGAHLHGKNSSVLGRLARSKSLWERRISILSTHYFIRQGEGDETLRIAELLLRDPHDLIHKAVGWMLREVGNRCSVEKECEFLDRHSALMPRTMLRYAIERFSSEMKSRYMKKAST
jgi:3-methyladenine DNA glycosylase AlkD